MIPVLKKFLETYDGKKDHKFWNSCYKICFPGGSTKGCGAVNGWVQNFYPYDSKNEKSQCLLNLDKIQYHLDKINEYSKKGRSFVDHHDHEGLNHIKKPYGITKTPFTWNNYEMEFFGGFVGI